MNRREMETVAERRILAAIEKLFPAIRDCLTKVEPLEAYALLGNLAVETIARFPPAERMQLVEAWVVTFREGVVETIRAAD